MVAADDCTIIVNNAPNSAKNNIVKNENWVYSLISTDSLNRKSRFNISVLNNETDMRISDNPINIDPIKSSKQQMNEHFKENATSVYHPCGSCKMGPNKKTSVVSNRLKVHDTENLWVVDASVFPNITSGNINAPVIMTAYIGGNLILEDIKKII